MQTPVSRGKQSVSRPKCYELVLNRHSGTQSSSVSRSTQGVSKPKCYIFFLHKHKILPIRRGETRCFLIKMLQAGHEHAQNPQHPCISTINTIKSFQNITTANLQILKVKRINIDVMFKLKVKRIVSITSDTINSKTNFRPWIASDPIN